MVEINTFADGKFVPYDTIQQWEANRLASVNGFFVHRLLGLSIGDRQDSTMDEQRQELAELKCKLGDDKVHHILRLYLALAQVMMIIVSFLSFGRRKFSIVEMVITGTDMDPATFLTRLECLFLNGADEYKMMRLKSCPDHYLISMTNDNTMEIIETTGGSPLPTQFFFRQGDEEGMRSKRDPTYDVQMHGAARSKSGTIIGALRHQIRKEPNGDGLRAKLLIEFPSLMPNYMIRQHQAHLMCEFNHWFRDVLAMHS
ncbi:hypothetical protein BGZ81_001435 [Podila clonocystis]|nr:hypothetical protein BGZ81_001435 [Podila clonocystis]